MLRAALTGGIACGKSTVLQCFREEDPAYVYTLSSDEIVHQLYQPGSKTVSAVAAAFGNQVVAADGSIDRQRLADIAFRDEASRKRLESIVHPAVIQWQSDWMSQLEQQHPEARLALVEIPLLFEAGSEKRFDKTTMREFDAMCLTKIEVLSPKDIQGIRKREGVSQTVFAHYLNVTPNLVSQWERGDKRPSGTSLKLLALVKAKGLDAIA